MEILDKQNILKNEPLQKSGDHSDQLVQISFKPRRKSDMHPIRWVWADFYHLSVVQLYEILALRESIFIVEQNVPYVDIDGKDIHCIHLMGYKENEMIGYMRLVPLDLFEKGYYSFGRVVVKAEERGTGLGRKLVQEGIRRLDEIRNDYPIKISSQLYLKDFYSSFGFIPIGDPYIEDQISHIAMVRQDSRSEK